MEFIAGHSPYLVIKIRAQGHLDLSRLKGVLHPVHTHYDKRHGLFFLAFPSEDVDQLLQAFVTLLPDADIVETSVTSLPSQTGYIRRFSDRLTIICPGQGMGPVDGQIILRSSLAFGSGFHPTTQICMNLLEEAFLRFKIRNVFDLGTGSGVLALAARTLGAKRIVATDIDLRACMEALENVRANHCEANICVINDSYSCGRPEGFELLLANLTINTIVTIGRHFKTLVRPQAAMVLSGFTAEQVDVVCDAVGLTKVIETRNLEGWAGILAIRAGK